MIRSTKELIRMKSIKLAVIGVLLLPALVFAHGPSRQKVTESIEIDAAPDKVWAILQDFCSIKDWHPAINSCQSDQFDVGAIREIELANGEKIAEKLFKRDEEKMRMQYAMQLEKGRIIDGLPIATHGSTMTVKDNGGKTTVEWKGAFYRSFPGQQPPPELSDAACIEAVTKLYSEGLQGLKAMAEK